MNTALIPLPTSFHKTQDCAKTIVDRGRGERTSIERRHIHCSFYLTVKTNSDVSSQDQIYK